MVTKNVLAAVIDQYVARLNLAVADGLASIAPKLCALVWPAENRHGLIASPAVGVVPAGVVGWSNDMFRNKIDTRHDGMEDRRSDHWLREGQQGVWTRAQSAPRRSLFTPFRCPGGPSRSSIIKIVPSH